VAAELGVHPIACVGRDLSDGGRDVTETAAGHRCGDTSVECSSRRIDEGLVGRVGTAADDDRDRGIGYPTVDRHGEVQTQHVTVAQHVVVWHPMEHSIIHRKADDVAKRAPSEGRRIVPVAGFGATIRDQLTGMVFELHQVDPGLRLGRQCRQGVGDEFTGDRHLVDLLGGLEFDHACLRVQRYVSKPAVFVYQPTIPVPVLVYRLC
jgi:hypothetical protein